MKMDLIDGFGRVSPGFGSDPPTGLDRARGSPHLHTSGSHFIFEGDKHDVLPHTVYDSRWHGQL